MIKLSDMKLNPENPRFIRDEKFKKLVASVKDFPKMMPLRPIVIDKDGMILGGNMRYRACKELGMKEIPNEWVICAEDLTDEEKRRFIIEDNMPFGEWDFEILANEWKVDELLNFGFDAEELAGDFGASEEPKEKKGNENNPVQNKKKCIVITPCNEEERGRLITFLNTYSIEFYEEVKKEGR